MSGTPAPTTEKTTVVSVLDHPTSKWVNISSKLLSLLIGCSCSCKEQSEQVQKLLYQEVFSVRAGWEISPFSSRREGVELEWTTITSRCWEAEMNAAACLPSFRDSCVPYSQKSLYPQHLLWPVVTLITPWMLEVPSPLPYSWYLKSSSGWIICCKALS